MTRIRAVGYAAATAMEVGYLLHVGLPTLLPPAPCGERLLAVCVLVNPFPWPWIALTLLLLFSAVGIILRKRVGVPAGFLAQSLFLLPFVRDAVNAVGSFLFTGSGYDAVDPDYRNLALVVLVLALAVGPAFTFLLQMSWRQVTPNPRMARAGAALLVVQLSILVVVAVVVFRATLHDCEFYGANPPMADGEPWCTPFAELDLTPYLALVAPSFAVLLTVSVGLWQGRHWAIAGGTVWQLLLAVVLASMGLALWTEPSQNAWYDHFPAWTSPRQLAYALIFVFPVPALATLLAARWQHADGHRPRLSTRIPVDSFDVR